MIKLLSNRPVLVTRPFTVEEMHLTLDDQPLALPYYRLLCPDWVNVLPVTADRRAILIRQPRMGPLKAVLETPGGVIDAGERDPTMAAVRELEEETGFTSQRLLPLGAMNPNPALNNNRCHFFLALGCQPVAERRHFPDADERITPELVDITELDALVRTGRVDHALSALCILLAGKYLDIGAGDRQP